jgi:MOSC domain-containing protein YiiM
MGKVIATNIGKKVTIIHNNKELETGIYKFSVEKPVFLGETGVDTDQVIDTRYHGGLEKACYLYPSENYTYWKSFFPKLKWEWGMFGENLTVEGLQEADIAIGNIYKIGEAIVQVTQPRQPCFKLGVRLNDPRIVKLFSNAPYPGIYVRVLQTDFVKAGDEISLIEEKKESILLTDVFALLMKRNNDEQLMESAINNPFLAESAKKDLMEIREKKKNKTT